jgi:hypothetical protein
MPANLGHNELSALLTPQKRRVDIPDFNIFVGAKGLQDMLPRNPHGTEAYVSYDQPLRSISTCYTTHHEVKAARTRQRLQSRDVSKYPQVSTCVMHMHEVQ